MKVDELRVLVGLDVDLEVLLKAKPGSKEANIIKMYCEAKERANSMGKIYKDLDKKMNTLTDKVEEIRKERDKLDERYHNKLSKMQDAI